MRAQRGGDLQVAAEIELEEAFTGVTARVPVEAAMPCERCEASGAEPETGSRTCPTCGGAGIVRSVSQNIFGQFVQQRTCPDCGGSGEVLAQPCSECAGEGLRLVRRELEVDIPAGIHDGQQIRVRGEGHAGFRSRERGNAFVVVRVGPDPRFVRDGDDLHTALRLTMTDAALGTTATVASLSGELEVEVPPGTQPGEVRVLAGEGMPSLRGSRRGALYVRLDVAVPTVLDPEQRRLLEDVDHSLGPEAYVQKADNGEGFFQRLKSALR
jgi:molecular chaperone DnaJ